MARPLHRHRGFVAVPLAALWLAAGCSPPPAVKTAPVAAPDHDHHDDHHHDDHDEHAHPTTLAEGVAALEKAAATVKDRLAAGAREEADDSVHALGHLLEDVQGLVRKSDLSDAAKVAATEALDELFNTFDTLDTALHAEPGEGAAPADVHASVAPRIKDAIEVLRGAVVPKAAAEEDAAVSIIREAQKARKEND